MKTRRGQKCSASLIGVIGAGLTLSLRLIA